MTEGLQAKGKRKIYNLNRSEIILHHFTKAEDVKKCIKNTVTIIEVNLLYYAILIFFILLCKENNKEFYIQSTQLKPTLS